MKIKEMLNSILVSMPLVREPEEILIRLTEISLQIFCKDCNYLISKNCSLWNKPVAEAVEHTHDILYEWERIRK